MEGCIDSCIRSGSQELGTHQRTRKQPTKDNSVYVPYVESLRNLPAVSKINIERQED